MIKFSIYPKSNSEKQNYHVFQLQVTGIKKRLIYSTGEKILNSDLKFWNEGRIIEKQRGSELFKLNAKFDRMKKVAERAHENGENIRDALDAMKGIVKEKKVKTISGFYGLLDNMCIAGFKRDSEDRPLSTASLRSYSTLRSLLSKYDSDQLLTFESWTVTEWQLFRGWLEKRGVRKKSLSQNSISTMCALLKAVLNDGYERGLATSMPWKKKGFRAAKVKIEKPFLKGYSINEFFEATITNRDMRLARDYWVMAADCGGIRFIDWHFIRDGNYVFDQDGGEYLEFIPQKTRKHFTKVRIFLTDRFKTIRSAYGGRMPKVPSYHRTLRYLKAAALIAGLENASEIKTHTARRSYINNRILAGVPKDKIKMVTAHRSDAFDTYLNISLIDSGREQKQQYEEEQRRMNKLKAV